VKYFSAFSGIGGFELGIEQAHEVSKLRPAHKKRREEVRQAARSAHQRNSIRHNNRSERFTCAGYSEIDKFALKVYQTHFPSHTNYGDITKIQTNALPDFDILIGGFPCQAFSNAGKRQGFADPRGSMFFELVRILRAKRPRYFIFENVKGLLSHDNGQTFKTVITTLAKLGYRLEWQVLNSSHFGVPQSRERVFIIGRLGTAGGQEIFPLCQDGSEALIVPTITTRTASNSNGAFVSEKPPQEIKQLVGGSQGSRIYDPAGLSPTLSSNGGGVGAKTGLYLTKKTRVRRLTPTECERLQGFPNGWTEGLSDTQRYKTLGNAVTVNVVQKIIERMFYQK
jgi:DNA (cytosine-5)-methyltransferase 1